MYTTILLLGLLQYSNQDTIVGTRIRKCFESQKYSESKLTEELIGSWKVKSQYCYWSKQNDLSNTIIIVTFHSDGTYESTLNSKVLQNGKWSIKTGNEHLYLDLDKENPILDSNIALCEKELYFNTVGSDGCENILFKIE